MPLPLKETTNIDHLLPPKEEKKKMAERRVSTVELWRRERGIGEGESAASYLIKVKDSPTDFTQVAQMQSWIEESVEGGSPLVPNGEYVLLKVHRELSVEEVSRRVVTVSGESSSENGLEESSEATA